jgi:hypothetical protein
VTLKKTVTLRKGEPRTLRAQKHGRTLPRPFQEWEQKVAPDGRRFFSNRTLKKTQWVDPRSQEDPGSPI